MLRGIDQLLTGDLLKILQDMGHGDELALVDRNFPADSVARHTVSGLLVRDEGVDIPRMAKAILSVYPLDSFVDEPILHMQIVGEPEARLAVHKDLHAVAEKAEGHAVKMGSIERFAFYERARECYAVIACGEVRPYGCFLLKKGVI